MKEYQLEKYHGKDSRHECPNCHDKQSFAYYVNTYTGEPIDPICGRCNHETKCGYHYPPSQYFKDKGITDEQRPKKPIKKQLRALRPSFIDTDTFKASLKIYGDNRFVTYIRRKFGNDAANELITKYYIASSRHWAGATVFWQIDRFGKIHTGKIMLYDPATGKRMKQDPTTGKDRNFVSWVHSVLNLKDYNLEQCLFGEHLLNTDCQSLVCIVESEKTAIICSRLVPDALWLATGGCGLLSKKICQPLAGRDIVLMPDNGKFDDWAKRGRELMGFCRSVHVCDIMEQKATNKGDDLCDLLIERYTNGTLDQSVFDGATFHRLRN